MTPKEQQLLNIFILLALHNAGEVGVQAETLLTRARVESNRDLTLPQLETALRGLADGRLISSYGTALGVQRWKILGLGRNALEEQGLA